MYTPVAKQEKLFRQRGVQTPRLVSSFARQGNNLIVDDFPIYIDMVISWSNVNPGENHYEKARE
jgi:hypothetical protein